MKSLNCFCKDINNTVWINSLFVLALFAFSVISFVHIFTMLGLFMDTYEHIHASWLISEGFVPYRDFFEHHHPLLWYLFAPLTQLFYRDVNIIYVARFIAVLSYLAVFFLVYKITYQYTKSKLSAKLALLFLLCFPQLWQDIPNIRPDIFMYLSMLTAIYYFFIYLDKKKWIYLFCSYLFWFISFLFLQKSAISILGFCFVNAYLFFIKEIKFSDILRASVVPVFISAFILFLLHRSGTLHPWFLYNFTFNLVIKDGYGTYSSGLSVLPSLALVLTLIITRNVRLSSKSICLICILIANWIQLLNFAPYIQYYVFFFIIAAILVSPLLLDVFNKHFLITFLCISFSLVFSWFHIFSINTFTKFKNDVALVKYIMEHTEANDKMLNDQYPHCFFNFDTDFYWFGFNNAAILADLYLDKPFDYNESIKLNKPKYMILHKNMFDYLSFHNARWLIDRNTALIQKAAHGDKTALDKMNKVNIDYWNVDMDYIKEHYKLIDTFDSTELWQRIDIE